MNSLHPHDIEIEINSHCNLSCSYCPNSITERIEKGEMDPALFHKIIDQLSERQYRGRISFSFYNEPMLSKNFDLFVKTVSEKLPHSPMDLYTNGMFIKDEKRAEELVSLGLTKVIITKHEAVKKLPIESFIDKLKPTLKNHFDFRSFEELKLTNRGGLLEGIGEKVVKNLPCQIPSLMLTVTVQGNILPCFEDYKQEKGMGNVNEKHILDIWNSEKFVAFRESLKKGERDKHSICKDCNRISENLRPENNKNFFGDEEIEAIKRVVQKGNFFRYQEAKSECDLFEEEFSKKINSPFSLLVTSGTNALILALQAEGIGSGDEVIIPSYTYVATASAVVSVGATPIIANVDQNLGLCPLDTEAKLSKRTKAIIPVHMDGLLSNLTELKVLSDKHNLIMIEDAAQCLGGLYKNKYAGTIGDYGCFSLNMEKTLTAGEGGIVVTKTKEQYEKLCMLSDTGFGFSPHNKKFFEYEKPQLSSSMRVSEITGAIMREQLKKLDLILMEFKIRKKILINHLSSRSDLLVKGHDIDGEINSSVILRFSDPEIALRASLELRNARIPAFPLSLKPAHVSWKWSKVLEQKTNRTYPKKEVIQSFEILMSCLKIKIDPSLSIEKTQKMAVSINQVLNKLGL